MTAAPPYPVTASEAPRALTPRGCRGVVGWDMPVPMLPEALWWDHNAHYHRWMLRRVPAGTGAALDVGSGRGRLARRLAARCSDVDALDRSPAMVEAARAGGCGSGTGTVRWLLGDVLDTDVALRPGGYDVVTAVASLHHLPLPSGLDRLASLVRPGGVLLVVGLYRADTATDRLLEVLALPANAAVGLWLFAGGRAGRSDDPGMPVREPAATMGELRRAAAASVAGAVLRRRLFWRFTLVWQAPVDGAYRGITTLDPRHGAGIP